MQKGAWRTLRAGGPEKTTQPRSSKLILRRHPGHIQIGNNYIRQGLAERVQAIYSVRSCQNLIALTFQNLPREFSYRRFVLHDKNPVPATVD